MLLLYDMRAQVLTSEDVTLSSCLTENISISTTSIAEATKSHQFPHIDVFIVYLILS